LESFGKDQCFGSGQYISKSLDDLGLRLNVYFSCDGFSSESVVGLTRLSGMINLTSLFFSIHHSSSLLFEKAFDAVQLIVSDNFF
jgi:hypothetical protein